MYTSCTVGGAGWGAVIKRNPLGNPHLGTEGWGPTLWKKHTTTRSQVSAPSALTCDSDRISLCRKSGCSGARPPGLVPLPLLALCCAGDLCAPVSIQDGDRSITYLTEPLWESMRSFTGHLHTTWGPQTVFHKCPALLSDAFTSQRKK